MTVRILTGDCRYVLAQLPKESVQCVVTSPPYWGLRDYGLPPSVWGGDDDCVHEWADSSYHLQDHGDDGAGGGLQGSRRNQQQTRIGALVAGTCRHCGAWRGVLGLEPLHDCGAWAWGGEPCNVCYVCHMRRIFADIWRVLRDDGVLWLNLGDSYASRPQSESVMQPDKMAPHRRADGRCQTTALKPKDMAGIPWRVALALQVDGWYLRMDNVWGKTNAMPESVMDRPTKAHEYVFLLSKSRHYFYDAYAVRKRGEAHAGDAGAFSRNGSRQQPAIPGQKYAVHRPALGDRAPAGRNLRSVWNMSVARLTEAHFATFPPELPEICIKAGTSECGCCPKCGAPWERVVSKNLVPTRKAAKTFIVDARDLAADRNDQGSNRQKDGHKSGYIRADTTIGWKPTCECYRTHNSRKRRQQDLQADLMLVARRALKNDRDELGRRDIDYFKRVLECAQYTWDSRVLHADAPTRPVTVLDPFGGAGTTGLVADRLGRDAILIELNEEYAEMARRRIAEDAGMFADVEMPADASPAQLNLFQDGRD